MHLLDSWFNSNQHLQKKWIQHMQEFFTYRTLLTKDEKVKIVLTSIQIAQKQNKKKCT